MDSEAETKAHENFTRAGAIRHGLPAFAYNSETFHATENERLFSRAWVFAGFAHEMPKRGDVMPVTVAGKPVLLVRGDDGGDNDKISAFHNVCRHRCLKLVNAPGNVGRMIRCPYHSWVYALDGSLRATPFFGGVGDQTTAQTPAGFDKTKNGLVKIHCAVWHDWIFVNLDDNPSSFNQFIQPVVARLAHLDLSQLKPVALLDFGVINANWKFLMENFIEPYHVQFVHSATTDQPLTDHAAFIDRHCLGCTVKVSTPAQTGNDTLAVDSSYLTLFPNFVLATYAPDQLGVHLNTPINARQTRQHRAIYLLRAGKTSAAEINALDKLWRKVHDEDHAMCERLQLGRASPVAEAGGWLSPKWEPAVRRFQELVYDATIKENPPTRGKNERHRNRYGNAS